MKRKIIKRHEIERHLDSEEKVVFLDSSPVQEISSPPKTVFTTFHGTDSQGTFSVYREDSNDTVLLNEDAYSFQIRGSEQEAEIKGPLQTESHHIDDIPFSLKSFAPKRIINKLSNLRRIKNNKKIPRKPGN